MRSALLDLPPLQYLQLFVTKEITPRDIVGISEVLLSPPRCVVYLYESALGHAAETRGDVEDAAKRAEAVQLLEDGGTDSGLGS